MSTSVKLQYLSGEVLAVLEGLKDDDTLQTVKALGDTHLPPGVSIDSLLGDDSAVCSLSEPLSSAPGVGEKQLTVVTGEQPPERYVTLDNGGHPFLVSILSRNAEHSVSICCLKGDAGPDEASSPSGEVKKQKVGKWMWLHNYETQKPLFHERVKQVWVGKSPLNRMTRSSGGHGADFDGNSILVEKMDGDYIFVGHEVLSFKAPAKLVEHVSPVGNSSVPYPYAVDADGRHYLFIEKVVLDQIPTDAEHPDDPDPYTHYYEMKLDQCDFRLTCDGHKLSPYHAASGRLPAGAQCQKVSAEGTEELSPERVIELGRQMMKAHGLSFLEGLEVMAPRM
ncbi:unnamed protein product [Durusdinium trenchii]|uniref:Uncharacterized protein n=2 Tax=Durusdinium trenchii TaxID=1381693 RepID=A0ABP0L2D9_9DINO